MREHQEIGEYISPQLAAARRRALDFRDRHAPGADHFYRGPLLPHLGNAATYAPTVGGETSPCRNTTGSNTP